MARQERSIRTGLPGQHVFRSNPRWNDREFPVAISDLSSDGRSRRQELRTHEPDTSPEGSPVMLHMSPSVSGLPGLAGIPSPSPSVEDLYAAAGAYTGLGAASPRAAEIVDVVMSTVAAMLADRSSPGGGSTPRWHDDMPPPAASRAW